MRTNLTTLTDGEFAEGLITSFADSARNATDWFLAGWYARECVRIARQFLL